MLRGTRGIFMRNIKKTLAETVLVLAVALLTAMLYRLALHGMGGMLEYAWGRMAYACFVLLIGDVVFKLVWYREMLFIRYEKDGKRKVRVIWQYWVGFLLLAAAIGLFDNAAAATEWLPFILMLAASASCAALAVAWDAKVYNFVIADPEEYENECLKNFRKHLPKKTTEEELAKRLRTFLRFRLKGDSLEGDVDVSRPLCGDTLETVDALSRRLAKEGAEAKTTDRDALTAGEAYVSLIAKNHFSPKAEEEEN